MKVKFNEVLRVPPLKSRTYKQLFPAMERKHNYDYLGKKVSLSPDAKLNTLVVNLGDTESNVKEKVVYYQGNEPVLSRRQKYEFTPDLHESLKRLGENIFAPDSFYNLVVAPLLGQKKHITASDLYSYHQCPHKVWRDANLPHEERDPANPFLKLLWEKGIQYEDKVLSTLGDYEDLSDGNIQERAIKTLGAMNRKVPVIYHGILLVDELKGEPDILRLQEDGTYIPIDIKAAMAYEGGDDFDKGKLKEYYAMQLCLYTDALIRLGYAREHKGIIFDIEGNEVFYDLNAKRNSRDKRTWWEVYLEKKDKVLALIQNRVQNDPAFFSGCKLCHWWSSCKSWCQDNDHTSLVYKLGRSASDVLRDDADITTVHDLAKIDVEALLEKKAEEGPDFLRGIAEGKLVPYVRRAAYFISGAHDVKILNPFSFPKKNIELFFDIEADPTQNIVYLHGVLERKNGVEKFYAFVADEVSDDAEKEAWKKFWEYVRSLPDDYSVYHYSHYERSVYKRMMAKYPDVVSEEELEHFFAPEHTVDLYKIVDQDTDWPLSSYSLKNVAQFIGFDWRDAHPSGASSIEWYNTWAKSKEEQALTRILEYNEDDCRATLVLKDYLEEKLKDIPCPTNS